MSYFSTYESIILCASLTYHSKMAVTQPLAIRFFNSRTMRWKNKNVREKKGLHKKASKYLSCKWTS